VDPYEQWLLVPHIFSGELVRVATSDGKFFESTAAYNEVYLPGYRSQRACVVVRGFGWLLVRADLEYPNRDLPSLNDCYQWCLPKGVVDWPSREQTLAKLTKRKVASEKLWQREYFEQVRIWK